MSAAPRVGSIIAGKYELTKLLGRGGMGEVYEAIHRELGRRVAIKFLLPDAARNEQQVLRFRKEARAAGRLAHENIAATYDIGISEDVQYLVLELLEGQDCARMLASLGRLEPGLAAEIVLQVCRGLDKAHAQGIVHRDLKPANLFLCTRADGSLLLKILDFGIAKLWSETLPSIPTETGAALGTPCYMSPEQARGDRSVDGRSDIYAIGVVLYELLSGQRPFLGETPLQILHRVLTTDPKPLGELFPQLDPDLVRVVERAMARDPAQRYASAEALAAAVAPFAAGNRTSAFSDDLTATLAASEPLIAAAAPAPTGAAPKRRLPRIAYGAAAVFAAFAATRLPGWSEVPHDAVSPATVSAGLESSPVRPPPNLRRASPEPVAPTAAGSEPLPSTSEKARVEAARPDLLEHVGDAAPSARRLRVAARATSRAGDSPPGWSSTFPEADGGSADPSPPRSDDARPASFETGSKLKIDPQNPYE